LGLSDCLWVWIRGLQLHSFFKLVSPLLAWMLISLTNKIPSIKQLEGKENDLKNQIYSKAV